MKTVSILFVLTSHSFVLDKSDKTGLWLEELTTPYYAFKDAGFNIQVASIKGGAVPIDPRSFSDEGENPESVKRFVGDKDLRIIIENSKSVYDVDYKSFDAVFLPGGHGTMWDFPSNPMLTEIVSDFYQNQKIVSAVCHGPAGLIEAVDKNGDPIVRNKKVSAFTNKEEKAVGLADKMPFMLEDKLRSLGAILQTTNNFEPFAVQDGNLITGQNPQSSEEVAKLVIESLKQ